MTPSVENTFSIVLIAISASTITYISAEIKQELKGIFPKSNKKAKHIQSSLGTPEGLVPRLPTDTNIHGCSSL